MIKPSMDMREICRLYNKRLYHIAYNITRDHYLAQDVVQESLLKAYKKMDSIDDQEKLGPGYPRLQPELRLILSEKKEG